MTGLPIDAVLPELLAALGASGRAVLQAPPGAGKTTLVPLAMLERIAPGARILMLEPRRVAARAAAERMAALLGEAVGSTVGYRIRGDSKAGRDTRIEVVTEGILTRMIQTDPDLPGVACVIFDEFHERSLNADLGLALCLELREALRPDLWLLAMSATLDAEPVARLMGDAPLITSRGRAHPVETRWFGAPRKLGRRELPGAVAEQIREALAEEEGSALVFLPGAGEIRAVASRLGDLAGIEIRPLYGAMPFSAQRAAIAASPGRKLILATAIAETSLTIEGVRIVIDAGYARRARFDPSSGMSRLVTERVTRAEADQRRGRAGRLGPGVCYRMWSRAEEGALAAFPPAEIEAADLTGLALELAQWGSDALPFLTPPPEEALGRARELLRDLGALDPVGGLTPHGREIAAVPAHPRLAHMLVRGGAGAEDIAALLSEGGARRIGDGVDIGRHLAALRGRRQDGGQDHGALARVREEARRLGRHRGPGRGLSAGALLSLAYPDRIALRRTGEAPRYLMSGGKGAVLPAGDALSNDRMLVICDLDGDRTEATARLAAPVSEAEIRDLHGARLEEVRICRWSARHRRVEARVQLRLGAIALEDSAWRDAPAEAMAEAALDGVRALGIDCLGWSRAARLFRARVEWVRQEGGDVPDMSDAGLMADLDAWLGPYLGGLRSAEDLAALDPLEALKARLGWERAGALDRIAPERFTAPTGTAVRIDYSDDQPSVAIRLQELFGLDAHPRIGPAQVPLRIDLLSPAQRPVQMTSDLPGFWRSSYADVRKDLRGRYPRHPWPEDPLSAAPTRRAKARG